jgi:hypothetical protein
MDTAATGVGERTGGKPMKCKVQLVACTQDGREVRMQKVAILESSTNRLNISA